MSHDHSAAHHHHHDHSAHLSNELGNVNRALIIGITLNFLFVVIEVFVGFYSNSLALLSDAGHNLGDVAGLLLALLAFRLSKNKSNKKFTYGYGKTTILAALFNAVILLISLGAIGYEAIQRLIHPEVLEGKIVSVVAGIGIVINAVTALQFFKDKDKDINAKGAYLHLALDALISIGVVIAGLIISFTHWYWLDSVVSLVIMLLVLYSTWELLQDSFVLSIDGVPRGVSINNLERVITTSAGVQSMHHLHVWSISSSENALTAHVVVNSYDPISLNQLKKHLRHELLHENIQHATFEFEIAEEECKNREH